MHLYLQPMRSIPVWYLTKQNTFSTPTFMNFYVLKTKNWKLKKASFSSKFDWVRCGQCFCRLKIHGIFFLAHLELTSIRRTRVSRPVLPPRESDGETSKLKFLHSVKSPYRFVICVFHWKKRPSVKIVANFFFTIVWKKKSRTSIGFRQ